ncbi:MAG: ParB N-terminal domain-containing protein [Nanoarchaeota archaeon]|nr:ParB N-terminal domain-containing protein [Nanoarchaeota archaeon]
MSLKTVNTTLDLELVTINPEYEKLMPQHTKDEYRELKESIKENGLWEPITVNQKNVILDGHNRFKICKELNIIPRFSIRVFEDPLDEKLYVIDSNLKRRHLRTLVKVELYLKHEEIEAEKADRRKKAGIKIQEPSGNITGRSKGDTREIMGAKIGISGRTYEKAKKILDKASPELIQKVREGKTSISYAYDMVSRAERHDDPPALPTGIYDVVYADPPWKYNYKARGNPEFHYPLMNDEEIWALKIPVAENAILFLWATNPKLPEALKTIEKWGFTYKTNFVWVKNKFGTGFYVRGQHELLLIATKGNIPTPVNDKRPSSIIEASAREHSRKPVEVYDIIEAMYPNRKYVELFARNNREGWVSWGDEI